MTGQGSAAPFAPGAARRLVLLGLLVTLLVPLGAAILASATHPGLAPAAAERARGVLMRTALVLHLGPVPLVTTLMVVVGLVANRLAPRSGLAPWIAGALALAAFTPAAFVSWFLGVRLMMAEAAMVEPPRCGQPFFGFIAFLFGSYLIMLPAYLVGWFGTWLVGRLARPPAA